MNTEKFMFSGNGGTQLSAVLYLPDETPKMTLQLIHGMTEHAERYERLAQELTAQGTAVVGFDLRGHGANGGSPYVASFSEGEWEASLEDMNLFFEYIDRRFENVPHFMLGFSLGSFLLREYLTAYPGKAAGAIIMGTGWQMPQILGLLRLVIRTQIAQVGFDGTSELVHKLSFETYNKKFAPNRTAFDWLCADEEQLNDYIADKLCRKEISAGLFYQLLGSMQRTSRADACAAWPKDMPVLLLGGQEDPVGDFGKGTHRVEAAMRGAGLSNVRMRIFPGARHDLLHEEQSGTAEAVRTLICEWLMERAHHYESVRRQGGYTA